jgi:integrase
MYPDGGGLYLQVTSAGAKSWIYRFSLRGKSREMGLGSLTTISLADARLKASECWRQRHEGIDPIEARKALRESAILDAAKAITFEEAAAKYISSHRAGWQNPKHAAQWESTLATYVEPVFGALSVQAVNTSLVIKVLEPIWATKPETAGRVRGRIEAVLDWAKVRGFRTGENPARWRGHLDHLLPARSKIRRVKHHAALPYAELPAFMNELRQQDGTAARALEFTILTAARTGETIGAVHVEFDVAKKLWSVPAQRMKARREHRIPLSPRALAILNDARSCRSPDCEYVFPGGKWRKPLSNMAMTEVLRRMDRGGVTVHGFRSTFRDWAAERTNFPNEVVEMALAHAVSDKVEAAYRRGDLFEKRQRLMSDWARYCCSGKHAGGDVVPIRRMNAAPRPE